MAGRIAVTGATGFIGRHIAERLRDEGWTVVAIVRPGSSKPLPDGVDRVVASLDRAAIVERCRNVDAIVHAAGIVRARSAAEYTAVNVGGTRAVVEAARALDARVVHLSSLTTVGPAPLERPCREGDPCTPITDYGVSKLEAETVLRAAIGVRWTILRPAAVYGPRDRQFLPLFQTARRGIFPRLPNGGVFFLTLVHVADVARAVAAVCSSTVADGETFFVGHGVPASIDDILRTLASTFNRAYHPIPVPFALVRLGAWLGVAGLSGERLREMHSVGFVCSVEGAERRLKFRATIDLTDGFESTAAWYRAQGWLR